MENQEIITNEEITETVEDVVVSNNSVKTIGIAVGGTAVAVAAVWAGYKYIVKPLIEKIKADKEAKIETECESNYDEEE